MKKTQKIWMWIFIAMFAVPEILFSVVPSSIINYSGKDFLTLSSLFINSRFFINNPTYFFATLIVEFVGIIGLLTLSIKSNKKIISIILGIILLWLIFISFLGFISNSISLVM